MKPHQRIRRITRTARAIADLARELTRFLLSVLAAGGLVIAVANSSGGADLLVSILELADSIR